MAKLLALLEKENRNKSEEGFSKVLHMEEEYVKELIHNTMPAQEIQIVLKVNNNFLEGMFLLKKEEYKSCGTVFEEKLLLHVTGQKNIISIIHDNLNWRKVIRGGYGKGNYFSDNAKLANEICNPRCGIKRAIIICKVLVGRTTHGSSGMMTPPRGIDTCTAYGGKVVIKFNDNEFLPLFVAYYDYKNG